VARTTQRNAKPRKPGGLLQYKVVELSTVDEGALEYTVNHWSRQGWNLDGVQFAMRESSKRPSMAFVFFTRDADEPVVASAPPEPPPAPAADAGDERTWGQAPERAADPWVRLARLASDEEGDDDDPGGGA
jgi:hypothetical protein